MTSSARNKELESIISLRIKRIQLSSKYSSLICGKSLNHLLNSDNLHLESKSCIVLINLEVDWIKIKFSIRLNTIDVVNTVNILRYIDSLNMLLTELRIQCSRFKGSRVNTRSSESYSEVLADWEILGNQSRRNTIITRFNDSLDTIIEILRSIRMLSIEISNLVLFEEHIAAIRTSVWEVTTIFKSSNKESHIEVEDIPVTDRL